MLERLPYGKFAIIQLLTMCPLDLLMMIEIKQGAKFMAFRLWGHG